MTKYQNQEKSVQRITQDEQIRQIFFSLRTLAFAFMCAGLLLMLIFYFIKIPKWLEFSVLAIFSISSALFIAARVKSIINAIKNPSATNNPNNHHKNIN